MGSWYSLLDITYEARALKLDSMMRTPVACPNDGTLLISGVNGQLHCPWDGWEPGMTPAEDVN